MDTIHDILLKLTTTGSRRPSQIYRDAI